MKRFWMTYEMGCKMRRFSIFNFLTAWQRRVQAHSSRFPSLCSIRFASMFAIFFFFFISGVGKLKKAARNGKVTFGFRVWKIYVNFEGTGNFLSRSNPEIGKSELWRGNPSWKWNDKAFSHQESCMQLLCNNIQHRSRKKGLKYKSKCL